MPKKAVSFTALVDTHYEGLYRFAYSMAKTPDWASDLVQQTFWIWAEKGSQLREKGKEKSWLFTTLYREYLKQAKQGARISYGEPRETPSQTIDGNKEVATRIDSQRLLDLLMGLEELFRAPLVLYFLKEMSYNEIAEVLDIPKGTVMSRLSRGKQKLRDLMESPTPEDAKIITLHRKEAHE